MCESHHVCCHTPSQGSKPWGWDAVNVVTVLLLFCLAAHLPCLLPLHSHSSQPPSSLCSGRASHLEQQAAGGDDIICTAAHCSTGSEQRHVRLLLTIPSLSLSLTLYLYLLRLRFSTHVSEGGGGGPGQFVVWWPRLFDPPLVRSA